MGTSHVYANKTTVNNNTKAAVSSEKATTKNAKQTTSAKYAPTQDKKALNKSVVDKNTSQLVNRSQIGNISCLSEASMNAGKTLELMTAIEKAICNHPDAKSAWIQTKIRAAQVKASKASYYPQVSGNVNYEWGKTDYQVKSADYLSYDTDTKRYGVALQANWLLFDFGSRKYLVKESQELLAMSFAQQDSILQTVILQTIQAYYQVIKVELQLENTKQLLSYAQKNYDIASARYNAGAGIKSDQLQMHANLIKAKSDLIKLSGDLKVAKGNLAAAMGQVAVQDFEIQKSSIKKIQLMDLKPIQTLLDQAAKSNPKLRESQYAISAAQAKVKSVERSNYPSVSFISSFNNSKQLGEGTFANNNQQIQAGVQVNIPLFDGFSRKYQAAEARQNLQLRYAEKEQIEQQLVQEIWKNYNQLQAATENVNALRVLNNSAEKSYEVSQGRYKAGVGNILELVNAQNLLTEAKMNYSTAVTEMLVIRFQLLSNLGTLNIWENPAPTETKENVAQTKVKEKSKTKKSK